MTGVNKAMVIGNLGRDPETRQLQSGSAVTSFSVATSESWRDKNTGEKKEETEWHNIVAFGKLADVAGQYLRKGSKVYVEGKIQTRSWEADGVTKYRTEIKANQLQMLDGRPQEGQRPAPAAAPSKETMADMDFDDDIPF